MNTKFPSARFVLDAAQLGAALALVGVRPSERSRLPDLPPPEQPILLLQNTPMLSDSGQQLSDEGAETLRLAADPARVLSCLANAAGEPTWKEVLFLHAEQAEGPFVALETHDGKYDLAFLPHATEAMARVEDLVGLRELPAQPDAPSVTLNLVAYAALLAAADALQATRLRNRLARTRPAKPVLTPGLLETQLNEGFSHADTRWAVTAGQRTCPTDLRVAAGRMATGLATLETAGLVGPVQRGYGFTPAGLLLAAALIELDQTAGFALTVPRGRERITIAQTALFCCAHAIWVSRAQDIAADNTNLSLSRVSRSGAIELIRTLLAPVDPITVARLATRQELPVERRCPSCGQPVKQGARFCTSCGANVAAEQALLCPRCGAKIADPNKEFCTGCGARLAPSLPAHSRMVAERRCANPQCGRIVPKGKRFCTACGTRLSQEE